MISRFSTAALPLLAASLLAGRAAAAPTTTKSARQDAGGERLVFAHYMVGITDGQTAEKWAADVAEAQAAGIAFVHQELSMFDNLDVAANVLMGREPLRAGPLRLVDRAASRAVVAPLLAPPLTVSYPWSALVALDDPVGAPGAPIVAPKVGDARVHDALLTRARS